MCDIAPHSEVEGNVPDRGSASPYGPRATALRVGIVALALALVGGGCTDQCLLNGECPGDTLCLDGHCRTPCVDDRACTVEQLCLGGGCRALAPGERAPCRDDSGCPDPDLGPPDLGPDLDPGPADLGARDTAPDPIRDAAPDLDPPDGSTPDLDLGPDDAALDLGPDAHFDAEPADGDLGVDLTGLYAVTTTVLVATGGDLAEGDDLRGIQRLDALGGTRYRLEVYGTDGHFEYGVEIDLASPDGPGRYQFEYTRDTPAPDGCVGTETRFQRGRFEEAPPGHRLLAGEERVVRYAGDDCAADGYLVRVETIWQPLPPP